MGPYFIKSWVPIRSLFLGLKVPISFGNSAIPCFAMTKKPERFVVGGCFIVNFDLNVQSGGGMHLVQFPISIAEVVKSVVAVSIRIQYE